MTLAHPENKGNTKKGEDRPQSKLLERDVEHIRQLYGTEIEFELWRDIYFETAARGVWTYKALGKYIGVSFSTIHSIVTRRTWSHVK